MPIPKHLQRASLARVAAAASVDSLQDIRERLDRIDQLLVIIVGALADEIEAAAATGRPLDFDGNFLPDERTPGTPL